MADQSTTQPSIPSEKAIRDQIALLSYIENLVKLRQDPNITPEKLPAVKAVLLKEVNEAINRHLISLLDEKAQVELEALLVRHAPDEELDKFFASKITDLETEIAGVLLNFRVAYLYPVRDRLKKQAAANKANDIPEPRSPAPVPINDVVSSDEDADLTDQLSPIPAANTKLN